MGTSIFIMAFGIFFQLWHVGSSSLTRGQTQAPCNGSSQSRPLDHQGCPMLFTLYTVYAYVYLFLLFRHSLGVTENTWPVKLKMSAAYKMGCWNDTPYGGWNKKTTWKAMVWHGRVTSRGTEAARARLGKVTGMTRSGQASHHLKLVVLAIYAE